MIKPVISANKKKILLILVGVLLLYGVSGGLSYVVFSTVLKIPITITTPFGSLTDVTSGYEEGEKNRPCPTNGALYTKKREDEWHGRRPLGVTVENHVDARPPLGLSRADIIYEAVAEGGITRFLSIFLCQQSGDIAPVRSARTYFLDWVSEYDAAYVHVGGANTPGPADALGQIRDYGIRDMDQFGLGFPTFWRGTDKLAPHNVHTTTKKLWEAADKRGYGSKNEGGKYWGETFTPWKFKDDAALQERGDQKPITVPFWTQAPDYTVKWQYDKNANLYRRFHGETAQVDPITNEQMSAKNIVVQFQVEKTANDGYPDGHLLYGTTGQGNALIFMDGKAIVGKWIKKDRVSRTKFVDLAGKEIELNRGLIWIEIIPVGNELSYK